jgi:hypothetical protein
LFKTEGLQKIFLRGWLCVAASEGFPVKAVVAGLFVHIVGVGKVRGEEGHLAVETKDRVGLLEVAIDANSLIKYKAFALEMIASCFLEIL